MSVDPIKKEKCDKTNETKFKKLAKNKKFAATNKDKIRKVRH